MTTLAEFCLVLKNVVNDYKRAMEKKISDANNKGEDLNHRSDKEWMYSFEDYYLNGNMEE